MAGSTLTQIKAAMVAIEAVGLRGLVGVDDLQAAHTSLKRTVADWPCTMRYSTKGDMRSMTLGNNPLGSDNPAPTRERLHYIDVLLVVGKTDDQAGGTDALQAQTDLWVDYFDDLYQAHRTIGGTVSDVLVNGYTNLIYKSTDGDFMAVVFHMMCLSRRAVITRA